MIQKETSNFTYLTLFFIIIHITSVKAIFIQSAENVKPNFPGVSRDLASFCAARPSLPIDLASMIIHVKRNVSFNYKLYLFSPEHVFQTGQVIPRDDFRIHSFPVKLKRLNEFWPSNVATFVYRSSKSDSLEEIKASKETSTFKLKQFFKPVPLEPMKVGRERKKSVKSVREQIRRRKADSPALPPEDARGEVLPGDDLETNSSNRHGRKEDETENLNRHIDFDRDDQVSLTRRAIYAEHQDYMAASVDFEGSIETNEGRRGRQQEKKNKKKKKRFSGNDFVVPVGSFSSFHVNTTYLVRKDFNQKEPQIIRILVEPNEFKVVNLHIISNGSQPSSSYPTNEDYNFLSHKLLRDPNTRITAINQIYEDWITRNFYTIVYIQRKLNVEEEEEEEDEEKNQEVREEENKDGSSSSSSSSLDDIDQDLEKDVASERKGITIVNDRLVFRGSSTSLLGADQLEYSVKAAAFITEKNGLHYYLEFLPSGKFYLAAVDWTKRPFKIIDSRRFPIKATKTLLDNEELLLCPPAVCYSNQPIDEVVSFGRITLSPRVQADVSILTSSSSALSSSDSSSTSSYMNWKASKANVKELADNLVAFKSALSINNLNDETSIKRPSSLISSNQTSLDLMRESREASSLVADDHQTINNENISLDNVVEELRLGSSQLQTRLHLRDWVWILTRITSHNIQSVQRQSLSRNDKQINYQQKQINDGGKFELRYELARRNDIKVKPDTYGYVLTGHEIDASYRVYNELYLISGHHLITVNYTMADETSVSSHPIGDEFLGLDSTLLDPITGAFYDRYNNQIFFFKGDRYVGYDYASKKPLDEFILQEINTSNLAQLDNMASQDQSMASAPLVSSLPVVDILGRQHQVDGVYHDFSSDLVYFFTGMKFYTFSAADFKNGTFSRTDAEHLLPEMFCINENFLNGCNFDEAFPNPCQANFHNKNDIKSGKLELEGESGGRIVGDLKNNKLNFTQEQQIKLRSIAGRTGLLNYLADNSLLNNKQAKSFFETTPFEYQPQERLVFYMLTAMVALMVLLVIVMIVVIFNWTKGKLITSKGEQNLSSKEINQMPETTRPHHYLSNQHQHRHHSRRSRDLRSTQYHDHFGKPVVKASNILTSKSARRHSEMVDNSVL